MLRPLVDKLRPLLIVIRRIRPAGEDAVVIVARLPIVLVRLRMRRQIFGHEAYLGIGTHAALEIGVEDTIENRPVVRRFAVRILTVGAGRTPLERRSPIART